MNCLYSFLTALALNPRSQEAFKKDPESFMAAAGLSDQDRTILRNRRNKDIAAAFIDELLAPAFWFIEPGPDPLPDPDPPETESSDAIPS